MKLVSYKRISSCFTPFVMYRRGLYLLSFSRKFPGKSADVVHRDLRAGIIIISYSTCYIYGAVAAPTFNVILTHYTVYTYQTPELIISINVFYYFIFYFSRLLRDLSAAIFNFWRILNGFYFLTWWATFDPNTLTRKLIYTHFCFKGFPLRGKKTFYSIKRMASAFWWPVIWSPWKWWRGVKLICSTTFLFDIEPARWCFVTKQTSQSSMGTIARANFLSSWINPVKMDGQLWASHM